MRLAILTTFVAVGLVATNAAAASGPEGVWILPEDSARVRISPCQDQPARLCGVIVAVKPRPAGQAAPKTKDGKPAPSAQSFVGRTILVGLKPNGTGKWNGGKFQFPGSDRSVNAAISLNKDGTLRVQGCVAVMCGGQNWRRAA